LRCARERPPPDSRDRRLQGMEVAEAAKGRPRDDSDADESGDIYRIICTTHDKGAALVFATANCISTCSHPSRSRRL